MILYGVFAGSSILLWVFFRKRKIGNCILIVGAFSILGLLYEYKGSEEQVLQHGNEILREEPGKSERAQQFLVSIEGAIEEAPLEVAVGALELDEEKQKEIFAKAQEELTGKGSSFWGANEDADHVSEDLVIPETLCNGLVQVTLTFDHSELIKGTGKINKEQLTTKGCLVKGTANLQYKEAISLYEFYFNVCKPQMSQEEAMLDALETKVKETEKESRTQEHFSLPSSIDGKNVSWTEKKTTIPGLFLGLGVAAAFLSLAYEQERKKQLAEERIRKLRLEYADVVSKLALLLGAGMTLAGAFKRLAITYENGRQREGEEPAYEEMLITYHEMQDGVGETKAYEHFAARCGTGEYRKLISILNQNMKKGSSGLEKILEQEVQEAFEQRKRMAKTLGEEAGTKLLVPMMLLLGEIIMIIMIPAVLSFQ